ncbi:MAG: carboxypeptidase-like regulatory domain-containing protein, partial [Cyclobacteriaceae bacterium]
MALKSIVAFAFLLTSTCAFAQSSVLLKGKILGKGAGAPIPYAHINIQNSGIGTVANSEGYFSLLVPEKYETETIKISCIGYKNVFYTISKNNTTDLKIFLEEDVAILESIVVIADDPAKRIVVEAINRIDSNYPSESEMLRGFVYEIAYSDSSKLHESYYVTESEIEAYKTSYSNSTKRGEIRILKGRSYFGENFDSLKMRFYAGAHDPHRFDFVIRRAGLLNKSNLDKYEFDIVDTLKYENEHLFVIAFTTKKASKLSGKLYITSESY